MTGYITSRQFGLLAVIKPHMAIDIQRAGQFGSLLEPLPRKHCRPLFRSITLTELR